MNKLKTRLTEQLGLVHPVISAPMAFAAGGQLAAAVSSAGGLGMIGGGYGDPEWLGAQFRAAGNQPVGCGFITWSLQKAPHLLDQALAEGPAAVMLSFGDPGPFAEKIHAAGSLLICQCQNLEHVKAALDVGAEVIVAQGAEAGGHGQARATMTLVPEVSDLLDARQSSALLVAAGGIADGRGLAAALMLGADGVLLGTRLWASREALVAKSHHQSILGTDGDGTIRTTVADIARQLDWPAGYSARIRRNAFTERWHGKEDELSRQALTEGRRYRQAALEADSENAAVWFGEAAGLIRDIPSAEMIIATMVSQAASLLRTRGGVFVSEDI